MKREALTLLTRLLTAALVACAAPCLAAAAHPALAPAGPEPLADSHFHISNYAMQGVPLKAFIDTYMGDQIARSVAIPLPIQQRWDRTERYADGQMPPNYYLGPKADLYYYSFIDALLAMEYLKLSPADRARIDPMIVAFNPTDQYAVQHIKRVLLTFPGVFSGLGEFTVHKEIVSDKIAQTPLKTTSAEPLPPDASEHGKLTLYSPALESILDFAAEAGLVVILHSDIYPVQVRHDGVLVGASPEAPRTWGMKHACAASPETQVIWAHTGLGRFVKPAANHLDLMSIVLDACPNWSTDLSWDLVQAYIVNPEPGMPSLADWARFVTRYQDRIFWGSDTVIYTRNKLDDQGKAVRGQRMPVAEYRAVSKVAQPLWDAVGPAVARKVRYENHIRVFDAARKKVRAWEAKHAKDDLWNLPAE